jgi:DivIVA domain-containing protein
MIDLTPLDVRNKRGDFKKLLRGYDPQEVDVFLEIVAERLENLVRETLALRERTATLEQQVGAQSGREQAVQDALVSAQELRADIHTQAQREADHVLREAESGARRLAAEAEANVRNQLRDAERRLEQGRDALEEMERRRTRFLKAFRQLLEREIDVVDVEDERLPLEVRPIDLDLGGERFAAPEPDQSEDDSGQGEAAIAPDLAVDELDAEYDREHEDGAGALEPESQAEPEGEEAAPVDSAGPLLFAFDEDDAGRSGGA